MSSNPPLAQSVTPENSDTTSIELDFNLETTPISEFIGLKINPFEQIKLAGFDIARFEIDPNDNRFDLGASFDGLSLGLNLDLNQPTLGSVKIVTRVVGKILQNKYLRKMLSSIFLTLFVVPSAAVKDYSV